MFKQICIALLALGFAGATLANPVEAGTVKTAKGTVTVERAGQKIAAAPGVKVYAADRVLTGADGAVGITLRDNTLLSAGPNSTLALDKFAFDSTTHAGTIDATLKRGTLSVVSGKIAKASPNAVTFRTPTTTLGVRGTEFVIEAADRGE
jgi:hypothetical protein